MPLVADICTLSDSFMHSIIKRFRQHRCSHQGAAATDVMPGGGLSQDGKSEHRVRCLGRHLQRPYTPIRRSFEYYLREHMHVCVCLQMTDWAGLNSAKTARPLNISGTVQMCQSTQKILLQSHNFICQMPMKLNDFRDTLLNASIQFAIKIDWKSCRKQDD